MPPVEHHDLDAERELLGAIQLDEVALPMAEAIVRAEDFYHPAHALIFATAQALRARGESVHVVTLASELKRQQKLAAIGGAVYLTDLTDSAPTTAHLETHATTIARHARARRLLQACREILQKGTLPETDPDELFAFADKCFVNATAHRANDGFVTFAEVINEVMTKVIDAVQTGRATTGLETGFLDLDTQTSGLHPGQLIVVAARPAMGKSSLAMQILEHVSETTQQWTAMFSLEMPRDELGNRYVASHAGVNQSFLRCPKFLGTSLNRVMEAANVGYKLPILVQDRNVTLNELRASCRRAKITHGIVLVAVDYIQLMHVEGRHENREREVGEISRSLKALAKELGIPIIALAQVNRDCEKRADKRPMLSDLRESGAIEQDADVVSFIYRDEVYNKDTQDKGIAEIIIAKQRNGPIDTIRLGWNGALTKFTNLDYSNAQRRPPKMPRMRAVVAGMALDVDDDSLEDR